MTQPLRGLSAAMGYTNLAIGIFHLALGTASVPGEQDANVTVDSRERFYGAVFAGYGLAWVAAARRSPIPPGAIRVLAGTLFVGGLGRLLSMAVRGRPHWFQIVLTVIELVLPPVYVVLAERGDTAEPH